MCELCCKHGTSNRSKIQQWRYIARLQQGGGQAQHVVELQQHRRRVVSAGVAPHVLVEALKAQTPAAETEGLVLTATEEVDLHRPALPDD